MSSSRGRDGRHLLWLRVCDDVEVAHRVVTNRELEEPVEQHPAGAGVAAVEPEGELVKVVGQVDMAEPVVPAVQATPPIEPHPDQPLWVTARLCPKPVENPDRAVFGSRLCAKILTPRRWPCRICQGGSVRSL